MSIFRKLRSVYRGGNIDEMCVEAIRSNRSRKDCSCSLARVLVGLTLLATSHFYHINSAKLDNERLDRQTFSAKITPFS